MRPCWLIGLLALCACDSTHRRPDPFRHASPPTGGSTTGSTLKPANLPLHHWKWTACGSISQVTDEPTFALPLSSEVTIVGRASGVLQRYEGDASPLEVRAPSSGVVNESERQFSPDGKLWAELGGGILSLRSSVDGSSVRNVLLQNPPCGDRLLFAPDSRHVVVFGQPATCVIDVEDGSVTTRLEGAYGPAGYADGLLTVGTDVGTLEAFDALGQQVAQMQIPVSVAPPEWSILSPRGDRLVRRDQDDQLVLHDVAQGTVLTSFPLIEPTFDGAAFSGDGELVLVGDFVLATADGSVVTRLDWVPGRPTRATLSTDGKRAAFWGGDDPHHPTLVDLATGKAVRAFGGHSVGPVGISVSPDGTRFTTTSGQWLLSWRIAEPFEVSLPEWTGDAGTNEAGREVYSQYSPDGTLLAVSGTARGVFWADGRPALLAPPPKITHGCHYSHFAFSNDGRWLAGGGGDFAVDVLDAKTLATVAQLPSSSCNAAAAFSPDGMFLATSAAEIYRVQDWSRVTPERLNSETVRDGALDGAAFMPDGRELVITRCAVGQIPYTTCSLDLWTAGGRPEGIALPLNGSRPDFSPEGDWLVVAGAVMPLGTQQWQPLAANVGPAAFLPNGDIIASRLDGAITRFCRSE